MNKKRHTKLIHEGKYVAEVEVELVETNQSWSPYLSLEDAYKLDEAREALRGGDLQSALQKSRVYELAPVTSKRKKSNGKRPSSRLKCRNPAKRFIYGKFALGLCLEEVKYGFDVWRQPG